MRDTLHMFKGYRVPPATVEAVRQAIIDTRSEIDLTALRALVLPALVAVDPGRAPREDAAIAAVDAFLFDAVRAGLVKRHSNGWRFSHWHRVKKQQGAACR